MRFRIKLAAVLACMFLGGVSSALAQQKGQWVPGQFGLNAVVIPDPGFTYANLALNYSASQLNGPNGNGIPGINGTYSFWVDENIFYYVPKHKFLGGYFMPYIAVNYANGELVANITGTNLNTGGGGSGLADTYVQPFNLGWHLKRADFNLGYAFTAPTGRFTAGASNNVGSGYWGNNITSGTTVYITKNKGTTANLSTDWEIHGQKSGTNITPGDAFTMEWGLGQVLPLKKDFSRLLQLGLLVMTNGRSRIAEERYSLVVLPSPRARFLTTRCMLLVFNPISFSRRRIWRPSSNTIMSTGPWLVRKAGPSDLVFRGPCGSRSQSLQSRKVRSSEESNSRTFASAISRQSHISICKSA